jgi:hypothetical protein
LCQAVSYLQSVTFTLNHNKIPMESVCGNRNKLPDLIWESHV